LVIFESTADDTYVQKFSYSLDDLSGWKQIADLDGQQAGDATLLQEPEGRACGLDFELTENPLVERWIRYFTGGSGPGQFNVSYGIAIDSEGSIYVSDESDRIQKFRLDGVAVEESSWGRPKALYR
jgi:hypothetical protein